MRASFRSAIPNHDRTNEVYGARLSKQDAKPCFRASAHLNQELRVPKVGANQNPDAPSCLVVEKALWTPNSPLLSIFVVLGQICVLKSGKKTSDLAGYFSPFKTQIGPKIKKMASDYFSASLLTQTGSKLGYQNRWNPTCLQKLVRSEPKTRFFPVHVTLISCFLLLARILCHWRETHFSRDRWTQRLPPSG